jgi:hypothetical protein
MQFVQTLKKKTFSDSPMKIVANAKYSGWVGIEYEGNVLSPDDGIMATKKLLEACM